jgi:hypothetical protein
MHFYFQSILAVIAERNKIAEIIGKCPNIETFYLFDCSEIAPEADDWSWRKIVS